MPDDSTIDPIYARGRVLFHRTADPRISRGHRACASCHPLDRYGADGIRMNNVLPGFIDSYPESEEAVRRIPTGRFGSVNEVAKTVGFLLSEDAAYITGQNIRVDGGLTRSV